MVRSLFPLAVGSWDSNIPLGVRVCCTSAANCVFIRALVVVLCPVLEPIIVLTMGYLSYILADLFEFSGIVR